MKPNPTRHASGMRPSVSLLGGSIRFERERKGWSQEDLANKVGATAADIAKVEAGRSAPSVDVERIAAALGVTVEQLAFAPNVTGVTKPGVG